MTLVQAKRASSGRGESGSWILSFTTKYAVNLRCGGAVHKTVGRCRPNALVRDRYRCAALCAMRYRADQGIGEHGPRERSSEITTITCQSHRRADVSRKLVSYHTRHNTASSRSRATVSTTTNHRSVRQSRIEWRSQENKKQQT